MASSNPLSLSGSFEAYSGPPLAILGVPFDNVTSAQTVNLIVEMIASRRPHYLATANVDFTVQAMHDPELKRILLDAHLVVCDGMPLVWASKWLGNPLPERVAGSDLVPLLLNVAEQKGYRVFFLGGADEVAKKAIENILKTHPKLKVSGHYSPPFAPLLEMDHQGIRERIRKAGADLLFVSFGCPKQEKWISMNYKELGVPVSVGVGATIDFLAGHMKRAPRWMQKCGLEWVYRLCQEPKRLFKRYFVDLWIFGRAIVAQLWSLRGRPSRPATAEPALAVASSAPYALGQPASLKLPDRLDAAAVRENGSAWHAALDSSPNNLIDASAVSFLDSTGVGFLVRLQKNCRSGGGTLVLIAASSGVMRSLGLMKLDTFFDLVPDQSAALELLAQRDRERVSPSSGRIDSLSWKGEITSANIALLWSQAEPALAENRSGGALTVDLSGVRFIDSGGAGLLVRMRKLAKRRDIALTLANPAPQVLTVLRLLKLEDFLFKS